MTRIVFTAMVKKEIDVETDEELVEAEIAFQDAPVGSVLCTEIKKSIE